MAQAVEKIVAQTFLELAEALETGSFGSRPKIAITGIGSEHGEETVLEGAVAAAGTGVEVHYIGTLTHPALRTVPAKDEEEARQRMEELLASGAVDGAVTMHYPFPIGVSTVGRVVTPGRGKSVFLATTTGTSSADRVEGMVKNAVYGLIAAKSCGVENPTLGILNVDGARQTEGILKELAKAGYPITFAQSVRADGGSVLRGNDLLTGAADVIVTDSLTGNILMKTLSAYTTGGSYEALGQGYGPGIGEGYDRLVLIVSRASGAPVIAGAIQYGAQLVRGKWKEVSGAEFAAAKAAGLGTLLAARKQKSATPPAEETVKAPPKEVVTAQLSGIEIMDLERGVEALWKAGIYAESGMGCTGPIILVSEAKAQAAAQLLQTGGFITQ